MRGRDVVFDFGVWLSFWLFVAAALLGCATVGPTESPRTGQEQAVWIVWHEVYKRGDRPPRVRYKEGAALDCNDDLGGKGFMTPVGCRQGVTYTPNEVIVAWEEGYTFSTSALAHELMHAAQARMVLFDPLHRTAEFQPGGLVDEANARLQEAGF